MSLQLHETVYGKRFFEHQLPELIKAINRNAAAIEKQNEIVEKQNEISDKTQEILKDQVETTKKMIQPQKSSYEEVIIEEIYLTGMALGLPIDEDSIESIVHDVLEKDFVWENLKQFITEKLQEIEEKKKNSPIVQFKKKD